MCGAGGARGAGLVVVVHHSLRLHAAGSEVRLPARRRVACASRETAQVRPAPPPPPPTPPTPPLHPRQCTRWNHRRGRWFECCCCSHVVNHI